MNDNQFIIQPEQISSEALDNIIGEFILREGTDYGNSDYTLEQKKQHVLAQLKSKKIVILFDNELGSCNLLSEQEFKKTQS